MQVLPPAATSQGSAAHQWAESLGAEECAHTADGFDARSGHRPWTSAHSRTYISCILVCYKQ